MRTLLNMILFVPIGNNYIIKFFSGNCDYKLQYHRYSVSVMPILSMKLFDHFGNHIWDLDKVPYITCILYLNQIGKNISFFVRWDKASQRGRKKSRKKIHFSEFEWEKEEQSTRMRTLSQ